MSEKETQKIEIACTMTLDAALFPPDDKQSQGWLLDILKNTPLHIMSDEVGDFVNDIPLDVHRVKKVE